MTHARLSSGVSLACEVHGDPADPVVFVILGITDNITGPHRFELRIVRVIHSPADAHSESMPQVTRATSQNASLQHAPSSMSVRISASRSALTV